VQLINSSGEGRGGAAVVGVETHLPKLGADLVAALAGLQVENLTHGGGW